MSRLTIKLFGPPQIELDGVALDLGHRKPIALLAYLAVTGQAHTRDALATLFWPEYGTARTYLRNNLWIIRKALGSRAETWLDIEHDLVSFKADAPLWLDVVEFQRRLTLCQTHEHPAQAMCGACLSSLIEAAALVRDDFLAGFTLRDSPAFDEWQFFQREGLRRAFATALETLVQHYNSQGEFAPAIQYARRWLALDPLHEPAHRALMQLYTALGEYAAALRQYQTCAQILQAELRAQPDPQTEALYKAIQTQQHLPPLGMAQPARLLSPITNALSTTTLRPISLPIPQAAVVQARPPTNLLEQLTPLVGREQVCVLLQSCLRRAAVRLVTLTGAGGIGKTRLALQAAADLLDDFIDGAYFVSLASTREANLVLMAIAQTLGVREAGSRPLLESMVNYLHDKGLLLVLDNFEHVVSAAPLVTDLLARCPRLKVLVTSREVLHLRGEHEFLVPALAVPTSHQSTPAATLSQYAAVQLFIQRAQAVKPDFAVNNASTPVVAEICIRLDGLPLAIELAAARIKFFSPQALLRKLALSPLEVLRGGARDMPERHQTLHNTIAWSYELLNAVERKLFQQLAIFVGGFTLEAAEQVCIQECAVEGDRALDRLLSLVDKSLVHHEMRKDDASRFMLLETIREFGLERLHESGEETVIGQRYAAYFLALVEAVEPALFSADSIATLELLELEHDNLRAVLRWASEHQAVEVGLRLVGVLYNFWHSHGYFEEGRAQINAVLALAQGSPPSLVYAKALFGAGFIDHALSYYRIAQHFYEQSLAMGRQLGDLSQVSLAAALLANVHFDLGEFDLADRYLTQGLQNGRAAQEHWHCGMMVTNMADHAALLGNFAQAQRLFDQPLTELRQIGQAWALGVAYYLWGKMVYYQGDQARTYEILLESRAISQVVTTRSTFYAEPGRILGLLAIEQGDFACAHQWLTEALTIINELGNRRDIAHNFDAFAQLALQQAQPERTLRLAGAAFVLRERMEFVLPPVEQRRFAQMCAIARRMLDATVVTGAWAAGAAMTLDDAVVYAFAEESLGVTEQMIEQGDGLDFIAPA